MRRKSFRTVFVSDIHLGNVKNQSDKFLRFLDSVSFENLVIVWDFIDYRQLNRFWKRWEKERKTLNYINNLAKSWINITYIQWNHDRELKCSDDIYLENISVVRDMYYKTNNWKVYYVTHWDCMDGINKNGNNMWQIWSIISWLLLKLEYLWNKNVYDSSYLSIAERLDGLVKKYRMPESKVQKKIMKFSRGLQCDGIIMWHFHDARHYKINGLDYFNTWERLKVCSVVVEDLKWNLDLFFYED